jgi:hypothetical protein
LAGRNEHEAAETIVDNKILLVFFFSGLDLLFKLQCGRWVPDWIPYEIKVGRLISSVFL